MSLPLDREAEQQEQSTVSADAGTEPGEPKRRKLQTKEKIFSRRTLAEQTEATFAAHFRFWETLERYRYNSFLRETVGHFGLPFLTILSFFKNTIVSASWLRLYVLPLYQHHTPITICDNLQLRMEACKGNGGPHGLPFLIILTYFENNSIGAI